MTFRDDLVARAIEQWTWFGKDEGREDKFIGPARKETVEPFSSRVADYWLAVPTKEYDDLLKGNAAAKAHGKLDGTINLAWSAAFISYCMQMAGAGSQFPYSAGHVKWMVQSIKAKTADKLTAPLVGYKTGKIPLEPGDLIARPRQSGITYANAVAKGWFKSHSDIVVEVDKPNRVAYVIGGNVGQSVSKAEVTITADGKLNDPDGWMVHIQNNIGTKPPAAPKPAAGPPKAG
jgi:hypothetical protein